MTTELSAPTPTSTDPGMATNPDTSTDPDTGSVSTHADLCADDALAAAWHRLSVRYHRVACEIDRTLQSSAQLTGSEFEVLELLAADDDNSMRMSELAGEVHLTQSALSRLVSALEKDGLVCRSMCDYDRRSVFTALTDAGRARYEAARPLQRAVLRSSAVDDDGRGLCGGAQLG